MSSHLSVRTFFPVPAISKDSRKEAINNNGWHFVGDTMDFIGIHLSFAIIFKSITGCQQFKKHRE